LWMPWRAAPADLVEVRVTPPGGPARGPVTTRPGLAEVLETGQGAAAVQIGEVRYTFRPAPPARGVITIALAPTASHTPGAALAPSGVWRIAVRRLAIAPAERVEVWIRRDETLPGFPQLGRQSYFDQPDYQRWDHLGGPLAVDPPGT